MVGGLRPGDEIVAPSSTAGTTATWTIRRDCTDVGSVSFFPAPGHRGWLLDGASVCAGLTIGVGAATP
jgi:hypothetical protein